MFLKCAIKGEAEYLITNDFKHGMQDYKNIIIVSSKEFITLYEKL